MIGTANLNLPGVSTRLAQLADDAAERFSDAILWESIDRDERLSFRQFSCLSRQCALGFASLGVGAGSRVAVMLPNVPAYAVTWFALARLGAVMIPVNMRYTARELEYVLRDSEAGVLVIDASCHELLRTLREGNTVPALKQIVEHGSAVTPDVRNWDDLIASAGDSALDESRIGPESLMSIQYTSGSTGLPKGCLLTQDYWMVLGYARSIQGPAPRRVLIDKPMSYMGGMWRFLVCLHVGATACVALQFTLSGLQQRLVEHRIDFFSATDAVARLPDHPGIADMSVAWISIAGLSHDLHRPLEAKFRSPVRELYGMTEAGAILYMPADAAHMSGSGSCGVPAPFRECRIVDGEGKDVQPGETGELWVRGRGIMRGYLNQPETTAAVFSDGWFRTGDLFQQDKAGYFYIKGRIKDSIRRSGENISTREVESVAAMVDGVQEVAAVGVPDPLRGQEVKLCVVLLPGHDRSLVGPERIISHCSKNLAAFKVPRYIEYLGEFPRTSSNKIAKQSLLTASGPIYDRTMEAWIDS
jgi:crotonobetaine/carnitine-CoA ligase